MAKFHVVAEDEEWVYPTMTGAYKLGCCDCGLVHNVVFQVVRVTDEQAPYEQDEILTDPQLRVRMNVERNNRSTAQLRRKHVKYGMYEDENGEKVITNFFNLEYERGYPVLADDGSVLPVQGDDLPRDKPGGMLP